MDFHILIVISCVFLFSLLSLLLINRFFRRKTFEEVVAEKRAYTEKIYGNQKAPKKPKKLPLKKVMKLEKKQRRKAQHKSAIPDNTVSAEESDAQSDKELAGPGLSKIHVEFEPEPEVVTYVADTLPKVSLPKPNAKKQKKSEKKSGILLNKNEQVAIKATTAVVEETNFELKHPKDVVELKKAEVSKQVATKKVKENKKEKPTTTATATNAIAAAITTTTVTTPTSTVAVNLPTANVTTANNNPDNIVAVEAKVEIKDVKPQEEKIRHTSPKNSQLLNKTKQQQVKKQNKETVATKQLVQALDKLSENDSVSVSLLMNLFRRAELNRSEIQILIDYLLNRQQDMPTTHAEWSDDQCQKLKRQLEEKERALAEEQEAALGLQTKLRELRAEVNSERLQINATVKAYTEKLHGKEQEIVGLTQELQALNEKLTVERQQFQAKLIHEKQTGTQDLLAQLQLMQNEIAHKDKCINDLTCLVNASRQSVEEAQKKNDIIQQQTQQIRGLEQQRDELEQLSNNQIFELEKLRTLETENAELKVETRNLQNALESAKADLVQARNELENLKAEVAHLRNYELNELQKDVQNVQTKNAELSQQLTGISNKNLEMSKEHTDLQTLLHNSQGQLAEKEHLLAEFNSKQADLLQRLQHLANSAQQQNVQQQELQQRVTKLLSDVANKDQLLQEMEQRSQQLNSREKELLQQLHEHKEKNNDLRLKNWKLIDALQNAEQKIISQLKLPTTSNPDIVQQQQQLLSAIQSPAASTDSAAKEQAKVRALYERLYPEAVKACASIALSASFNEWMEEVMSAHIKQEINNSVVPTPATATATTNTVALSSSHKSTQSNNDNNNNTNNNNNSSNSNKNNGTSNGAGAHNLHNETDLSNSSSSNNNNSSSSSNDENSSQINNNNNNNNTLATVDSKNDAEVQTLQLQNAQLRAKIDELTKLVTKTSNTLSDLESHAREQEEHWRSVVRSQEEKIQLLQHSNGEQDV